MGKKYGSYHLQYLFDDLHVIYMFFTYYVNFQLFQCKLYIPRPSKGYLQYTISIKWTAALTSQLEISTTEVLHDSVVVNRDAV